LTATAWVFGDHVSTDTITPGRYNVTTDATELAQAAFREHRPAFREEVEPGDVVVAGENFGCGSSRESAPRSLAANEVGAVVAEGFARIFYRNAVNVGLPVYVAPGVSELAEDGDEVDLDLEAGRLYAPAGSVELVDAGGLLADISRAGGILSYVRQRGFRL
jgi:3-isopropylmalate/(R)-2-methylmalate dehydratase small subunit